MGNANGSFCEWLKKANLDRGDMNDDEVDCAVRLFNAVNKSEQQEEVEAARYDDAALCAMISEIAGIDCSQNTLNIIAEHSRIYADPDGRIPYDEAIELARVAVMLKRAGKIGGAYGISMIGAAHDT